MKKISELFYLMILLSSVFQRACCAAEALDPKEIVAQIEKSYGLLSDVKANISEQNYSNGEQTEIKGDFQFKSPDKIKIDFEIKSNAGKYYSKNMFVYNGSVLWQEQTNPDTKITNVFKSALDDKAVQAQEIINQFNPKQQFADFIEQYDVTDVKMLNDENTSVYILYMDIKPAARERMVQMLKAKGAQQAEQMVLEKVVFYWDWNKEFAQKIESQSKDQAYKTLIEYSDAQVNSGIKDEVFDYKPAADITVIDMSKITEQEAGHREFEGSDNKAVGQVFPEFVLKDIFNDEYSAQSLKGKILIIDFWENGCEPCLKELPLIESLYQDIYTDEYVKILTVTTNKDKALELVDENSYSFPVLIDLKADLAKQLGVNSIPQTFVVDRQGKIAAVYMGYHPDIQETLKKDINRLKPEE